ncbi:MAG: hypothetical protein ABJB22_07670, partial [Verrucomicrobiota bacterium]
MDRETVPITQKLLAGAGGWPALKSAQELQRAGRVSDAEYKPPLLSGIVREGNRNLRSGLRVKSASDVENLCTCRESRQWGTICPHALAVGLAYLEREVVDAKSAEAKRPPVPQPPVTPEPHFVELGTEGAIPVALHFILPPQFDSAWAKQQIMIVIEAELSGKRTMLSALSNSEIYGCDTLDLAALDGLNQVAGSGEPLAPMRILSREDLLRLLHSLRGHP